MIKLIVKGNLFSKFESKLSESEFIIKIRTVVITVILMWGYTLAVAQKYEIGGIVGMSMYLGDANENAYFQGWNPAFGLIFRNDLNLRWALKTSFFKGKITGNTKNRMNILPYDYILFFFKRDFFELSEQIEFNFIPYSDKFKYLNTRKFSPYILTGLGFTLAGGRDNIFFGIHLPLGMGIKYKIIPKLDLSIEYTIHRLFDDSFDILDNLYGVKNGLFKNKDWYDTFFFSLTWELVLRNKRC